MPSSKQKRKKSIVIIPGSLRESLFFLLNINRDNAPDVRAGTHVVCVGAEVLRNWRIFVPDKFLLTPEEFLIVANCRTIVRLFPAKFLSDELFIIGEITTWYTYLEQQHKHEQGRIIKKIK